MHELRVLVQKHGGVIQRYYSQYVTGYDALVLTEIVQSLEGLSEDESTLLSDFCCDISHINRKFSNHFLANFFLNFLTNFLKRVL